MAKSSAGRLMSEWYDVSLKKEALPHRNSVVITVTQGAAAAFGIDDDDDKYSVSEMSVGATKNEKQGKNSREAFGTSGFRKNHLGLERMKSVVAETHMTDTESSSTENCKPETEESTPVPPVNSGQEEEGSPGEGASSRDDDSIVSSEVDDIDTLTGPSSFALFAQTKFQLRTTHVYSCAALQGSLLPKHDRADTLASLASWVTILRVMGDLPESSGQFLSVIGEEPSIISKVKAGFKRKYTKKDLDDTQKKYSEYFKDPVSAEVSDISFLPTGKETMLEKIQYLCALGIYRTDLRDELYCQLCKQLTNNPSRNSTVRGWVLMMLFAGCFTPSEKFAPCFRCFLKEGPTEFTQKVEKLTRRTSVAGTRGFPPSWLEFQAAKNSKPILLPVTFMNGQRILIEADAATTVRELSNNLAETLDFSDNEGFSIYVCLHQKISCLGHGLHRIMDAVSECEQHTKQMGMRESSSLWRLYYRKEYFTPWHDAKEDPSSTDIIYQQVMRGISLGEYQCQKEEVFVLLGAQRYYLEYSEVIDQKKLDNLCRNWFPDAWKEEKGVPYFVQKVEEAVTNNFGSKKPPHADIKADIVTFAINKWSLMFSRYYDANKVTGPGVKVNGPGFTAVNVVVGLSGKGMYVLDNGDSIRVQLPFYEMSKIVKHRHTVNITTVKDEEYSVMSNHSDDFHLLLTSFIEGLQMRSKYAIVIDNKQDLKKGDLITLDKAVKEYNKLDPFRGVCQRTGKPCDVPRDLVYILNTVDEPSSEVLTMFTVQLERDSQVFRNQDDGRPHTLQKYSRYHFRQPNENAVTKIFNKASIKRGKGKSDLIWQFSKDPIKKPLLRKSLNRDDTRLMACRTFTAVQQFMGDAHLKDNVTDIELANRWIVEPASRSRYLRDEVFCQVIKQLTNNSNKSSEERGWLLLLMLATTAIPGEGLYDEAQKFVRSSPLPIAKLCGERLERAKTRGCRLWPPHPAEHDMLSRKLPTVRVKVYIPDNTCQTFDVTSVTRIIDIKREVCTRLGLKTWEEYSLFMSFQDSVHSLQANEYYFDALSHAEMYWVSQKAAIRARLSGPLTPVLVMLKKVWVNIKPGHDSVADVSFHFPQELPNFIRGYHQTTDDVTARLASLAYRAKYGNEPKPLKETFSEVSKSIAPKKLLQTQSSEYWSKTITQYYDEGKDLSQDQAKASFLKVISQLTTYGSIFFEVKQRAQKDLPKNLLVAINMTGLHLIDSNTRRMLRTLEFSQIPNWAFDEDSITLMVIDGTNTIKMLLETSVGHNMDDILMAYISWVMNTQMRKKHGFAGSPAGESTC
ncbi:myosin-VIIa-like isoform X2 [Haliotis cracherodii]|uniref:myosin-VIIa-like isoform X2 n=1 Tax=Haliotis cracherodii TaxID=6455 RepID=UPI0039E93D46